MKEARTVARRIASARGSPRGPWGEAARAAARRPCCRRVPRSASFGEVLAHRVSAVADRAHRLLDLVGRDAEGLGPVADLVFLVHVDALSILSVRLALVVHGGGLL